ncbi:hypothetical protein [Streptomyces sp. NPDC057002]|uniref:hypothetical protein n=1 Tax=Streptomyces sp. NPDC057002 TaxID=3345992 RepID=UPI0036399295
MSEQEREAGLAAQDALLTDGTASGSDYKAAVDRLEKCLEEGEITLVNRGWNPVDHRSMNLWYRNADIPEDEVAARSDQCHTAHLGKVEQRYAQDHAPAMAAALLKYSRTCLSGQGIATAGDERNMPDLIRAVGPERENQAIECVEAGARKLYPKMPVAVR